VNTYWISSDPASDADIEAAFNWYESEQAGLGFEFLEEITAAYERILAGPQKYAVLRSEIRRTPLRRFPYGIYFAVEGDEIFIIAVLHSARDPEEWQFRI
jgi:plasmid stabilization system protein ParE